MSAPLVEQVARAMTGSGLFEHISGKWGVIWKAEQLPDEYQFRSDAIARIDRLRAQAAIAIVVEKTAEMFMDAIERGYPSEACTHDLGNGDCIQCYDDHLVCAVNSLLALSDRSGEG